MKDLCLGHVGYCAISFKFFDKSLVGPQFFPMSVYWGVGSTSPIELIKLRMQRLDFGYNGLELI